MHNSSSPTELIVALDVASAEAAQQALDALPPVLRTVKVGLELFISEGPSVLERVRAGGRRCFLDLKLHDIPNTVAQAVRAASRHDVFMLTVHAHGGATMLKAAVAAAAEAGPHRPHIVAVTTLTSLTQNDLHQIGVERALATHTIELGRLAIECGCDGLVCSPLELAAMRRTLGPSPLLVAPGVRPRGAALGDQKRVATPADAVQAGASFLVVGRPILDAPDPAAATRAILAEMQTASGEGPV